MSKQNAIENLAQAIMTMSEKLEKINAQLNNFHGFSPDKKNKIKAAKDKEPIKNEYVPVKQGDKITSEIMDNLRRQPKERLNGFELFLLFEE